MLSLTACIERINFNVDNVGGSNALLVIDGNITDRPGPYTVRIFRALNVDDDLRKASPFLAKRVTISDDNGISEELTSTSDGVYQSDPNGLRGAVGRSYTLRVEAFDGTIYESTPEKIFPASSIDQVYHEFVSNKPLNGETNYGFRIFIDSKSSPGDSEFIRWRFTGAYQVESFPQKNHLLCNCCMMTGPPDPISCSGYIYSGSSLRQIEECTCCSGWSIDNELKPQLNDNDIQSNGEYKKIEVGYVPFEYWSFAHNKYMVRVDQMSLTRDAYEFWKIIKDQKEGISSLFQPSFGKVKSNIMSSNPNRPVAGFFYASSVKTAFHFLTGADAPISIPPAPPQETECARWTSVTQAFDNVVLDTPEGWR